MKTVRLPHQTAYPKQIHFGLETYRVKYIKNLRSKRGKKFYADTNPETKVIRIKADLPPRLLLATIIHEILHVIEFEAPVKLKHKTVYALEKAILELLLDNFL